MVITYNVTTFIPELGSSTSGCSTLIDDIGSALEEAKKSLEDGYKVEIEPISVMSEAERP